MKKPTETAPIKECPPPSPSLSLSPRLTLDDLARDLRNISTQINRITAVVAFLSGTLFEQEQQEKK
jgi:hypothetical protein